jgi:hypothetical protein
MRRNLVIAAIAAIAACGLGTAPAVAATSRATPLGGSAASAAVYASPMGTRCTIVESKFPFLQIGEICVTVVDHGPELWRAEVSFRAISGELREVSVENLKFLVAGSLEERTGRVLKDVPGKRGMVPSNWWEDNLRHPTARAAVDNACMRWLDGARACTGSHWFYSSRVQL